MTPIEVIHYDTEIAIVKLLGEHDLSTRRELEKTLRELLHSGERLVVDLSQTEFIDSSVLNNLVQASSEARNRGLTITLQIQTGANVHRVLEVTGLLGRLPCAATRDEAITLARNGLASTETSSG